MLHHTYSIVHTVFLDHIFLQSLFLDSAAGQQLIVMAAVRVVRALCSTERHSKALTEADARDPRRSEIGAGWVLEQRCTAPKIISRENLLAI